MDKNVDTSPDPAQTPGDAAPAREFVSLQTRFNARRFRLRLLEPSGTDPQLLYRKLLDGAYDRPFLIEDGKRLSLCFALDGCVQSAMALADPNALISAYTRQMMGFLLFRANPAHILMIGLGGGSLAKYCYRHLPSAQITAVEVNAGVIELRDEFQIPADDDRLRVIHEDGGNFLRHTRTRHDVILVDAYNRRGLPPSVATQGFLECAHRALTAQGVLVMNITCIDPAWRKYVAAVKSAFGGNAIHVRVYGDGNAVVLAFKTAIDAQEFPLISRRASQLKERYGLDFAVLLRSLAALGRHSRIATRCG